LYQTRNDGLTFSKKDKAPIELLAYADSNYGDRRGHMVGKKYKSQGGFAIYVSNTLMSYRSKRHKSISMSSMEAEYIEATHCASEIKWWRRLLEAVGYPQKGPTPIMEDNKACIAFSLNNTAHERSKHIDIREYWLRDAVLDNTIEMLHVCTEDQIADIFTKYLGPTKFQKFKKLLLFGLHGHIPRSKALNVHSSVLALQAAGQGRKFRWFEVEDIEVW
jgi:hypothetical protein